jgi:hypothetical protein
VRANNDYITPKDFAAAMAEIKAENTKMLDRFMERLTLQAAAGGSKPPLAVKPTPFTHVKSVTIETPAEETE